MYSTNVSNKPTAGIESRFLNRSASYNQSIIEVTYQNFTFEKKIILDDYFI